MSVEEYTEQSVGTGGAIAISNRRIEGQPMPLLHQQQYNGGIRRQVRQHRPRAGSIILYVHDTPVRLFCPVPHSPYRTRVLRRRVLLYADGCGMWRRNRGRRKA